MGGENETLTLRVGEREGSSPRGRGKPVRAEALAVYAGLIPAWAGKTSSYDMGVQSPAAHPRVGGENS